MATVLENPAILEAKLKDINENNKEANIVNKIDITKKTPFYMIDKRMIPSKVSYILYLASCGAWWPYMMVFLTSIGLTPFEGGLVICVRTLVSTFAGPFWGFLSDSTGREKLIYTILVIGVIVTAFPAPFIAWSLNDFDRQQASVIRNGSSNLNTTLQKDTDLEKYCTSNCGDNLMLYAMLGLFSAMGIFEYTLPGFLDSNVMKIIESNKKKTDFGRQRLFGAIGFAIGSFSSGAASESFTHKHLSDYTGSLIVFLPFALLGLPFYWIVSWQARDFHQQNHSKTEIEKSSSELAMLTLKTCFKPYNAVFLASILVQCTVLGFQFSFLFLHMKDNMHSNQMAMGLSISVSNIAEAVLLLFTSMLIRRFGDMQCYIFGMFSNGVRFILLAYCTNPWLTLPIQLLHSFGFALNYAAQVEIVHKISPKEISTTMFGISMTLSFSLSNVIGTVIGGWVYGHYGGVFLFMAAGALLVGWSFMITLYYFSCNTCRTKSNPA